jgi:hypothetical protein
MDYTSIHPDGVVVEIKTSPESRYISVETIKESIRSLKVLWKTTSKPPEYIFIFPVNEIAGEALEVLKKFRYENKDLRIEWFDYRACENVFKEIGVSTSDDFTNFIEQNPKAMKYLKANRTE